MFSCLDTLETIVHSGYMRAVLIHIGPSSNTARAADLWQIKSIDLLFVILFWKEFIKCCQVGDYTEFYFLLIAG